jgi:hypothetical protein
MHSSPAPVRGPARPLLVAAALVCLPGAALGHGAQPRVTAIVFPAPLQGAPLLLTDTQGVFGFFGAEPRWLCEDAIASNASIVGVVATAAPGAWLVATTLGVYLSTDDACTFARTPGLPDGVAPSVVSAHPTRPDELVLLAVDIAGGASYGVYRSEDGGRTFSGPDLSAAAPWRTLLRDPEAPERLYLSGDAGTHRSDDAGVSWVPITVALEDEVVSPGSVEFLATRPGADEVWGVVQRVPETIVIRSQDRGETWTSVTRVPDLVDRLVFDAAGERALISTILGQVVRRDALDGAWSVGQGPVPGFGCVTRGPAPGDDTLYACADPFLTAPWSLARSDDFGRTWQSDLASLAAVTRRWACAGDTPAVTACAGLCPGQAPGATCDAPDAQVESPDAGPVSSDAAPGADATDAPLADATDAPLADANVVEATRPGQGDCRASPGRGRGWAVLWGLGIVGLLGRRRAVRSPRSQGR